MCAARKTFGHVFARDALKSSTFPTASIRQAMMGGFLSIAIEGGASVKRTLAFYITMPVGWWFPSRAHIPGAARPRRPKGTKSHRQGYERSIML